MPDRNYFADFDIFYIFYLYFQVEPRYKRLSTQYDLTPMGYKENIMKSYKNEKTATRGMKSNDTTIAAKDGGVFILRINSESKTRKYTLIGPQESKSFGNTSNPRWKSLVK